MVDQDHFLVIEDVYKSYGSKVILDNIDLKVSRSTFCTVVGPSGCGKSTLLRLILGQEASDSGKILLDGIPIGFADERRGIVFQKYSLFPHLTVLDNVALGLRLNRSAGLTNKEIKTTVMEYLARVRLDQHSSKYPHELSGGMRQRVAIVQALIKKPKILLMDEPFGALDPGTREDLQLFLLEHWEESKMTVFFVTHDLEEALFLGNRLLVLSQYYQDDRGSHKGHGAKLVADYHLKERAQPTEIKNSPRFIEFIKRIREQGFDPDLLQHARDFNLAHPDSFQTLTVDESRQ
ncbi:ABC transporter ATP-binding protein [Pseudobacteriovorax antillogorgiicola]|uniref:NitT/TauT family transport system ATP-binding protein n=2 Tax=Pseudobacteriovorax antillogorgiicola TaxID=1513793 RepID=A0A1Y6CCW5_9BACT|nr:ABC transporter ATP-binding protein [Pseudobacteriovorax antillogorgiicola]TCS48228.1 NitT/TauT family transport system ATP-binding protein [Pseudobacteriovorax antillogorgiicola]SMF57335.1 NitT/TauT family transport system ATP-binding protein [Pseudobacteriovorax antillogorgiicola]